MTHVATLICNPAAPILDAALLSRVQALIPGTPAPQWLDDEIAADFSFVPQDSAKTAVAFSRDFADFLRASFMEIPADFVVQPCAHRGKKLFLADMDSTMIGQECIDELADHAGIKAHVSAITERAMRGEIEFEPALRERVALLKGLREDIVEAILKERITLTPGARELIATMKAHGTYTCLVSGGFTLFTQRVGEMLGFHENRANVLNLANGLLEGIVTEPILGKEAKVQALTELTQRLALSPHDSLAVGDGANDIPMLQAAGFGVAYHGKPSVAQAAPARIDHGDLTALLYLQGYKRADFVTA